MVAPVPPLLVHLPVVGEVSALRQARMELEAVCALLGIDPRPARAVLDAWAALAEKLTPPEGRI